MSDIAIKIEGLSKQYRLGVVGTGTLSHDLQRWWITNILGREDPYLKIGETNTQASKGSSEYVWALRDINLEVKQGEILGIIGKNGAGKSTLLKILSRVTKPTTGSITYKGRIASLLEVGTGFHPEMTGRENIYMNGTIMGMTRWEITQRLDEIIAFAGVERYIDTPVKRYSSGMKVRLGFAIAAHLEPEILVVDEVLAVGDAEFQKKAIGKMQDVSKGEGRTVLFVSHNMASIKQLCSSCILLKNGGVDYTGETNDVIDIYVAVNEYNITQQLDKRTDRKGNGLAKFSNIFLEQNNQIIQNLQMGQSVCFNLTIRSKEYIENAHLVLSIYNGMGVLLTSTSSKFTNSETISLNKGKNTFKCNFDYLPFQAGRYYVNVIVADFNNYLDWVENAFTFDIIEDDIYNTGKTNLASKSLVILPNKWCIK